MFGGSVLVVGDIGRLQEFVHYAPFRDSEREKAIFGQAWIFNELVVVDGKCMDGEIFTQRTLVDPAIWKNEKVFCLHTGTGKFFPLLEKNFRENDMDAKLGRLTGHRGDDGQPLLRAELQCVFCCSGGFPPDADNLNEKAFDPHCLEEFGHLVKRVDVHAADRVDNAHIKAKGNCFFEIFGAGGKDIGAADRVVNCGSGPVEAEADNCLILANVFKKVVKEIAVCVHRYGLVAKLVGGFNPVCQVFVQGGFATEKNQVGLFVFLVEEAEPLLHGFFGHGLGTVLFLVDVAMTAA